MSSRRSVRIRLGLVAGASIAVLLPALLVGLTLVVGCSGGGRGPTHFFMTNSIFGWNPLTGDFASQGTLGEPPSIPKNMSIVFEFNDGVDGDSVTTESVVVQEISPDTGAPGPLAAVVFETTGNRLIISPLVSFTNTNVIFGFDDDATYQITFAQPPASKVVRSVHGSELDGRPGPFRFITTSAIFDRNPGAPEATIRLIHPSTLAEMETQDVPTSPVPLVYVEFDEGVLPPSVINGDSGTSDSIKVQLDINGDPDYNPAGDRVNLSGLFSFEGEVEFARVTFTPILTSIPTEEPDGSLYVVNVDGTVQDLAGNFSGENTRLLFRTVPGPSAVPADPIVEEFTNDLYEDSVVSSASWGHRIPEVLSAGIGGGRGLDGAFEPGSPDFQERWDGDPDDPSIKVDAKNLAVYFRTGASTEAKRRFEFTTFDLPLNWTARATGDHPLEILATGDVVVRGTLTVSGASGELINEGQTSPGKGGEARLGGGEGGQGGSVTDGVDDGGFGPALFEQPPPDDKDGNPFKNPFVSTQGVGGRSSLIDDEPDFPGDTDFGYTLEDVDRSSLLSSLGLDWGSLWLQPNVACDDGRYERWHPTFKVKELVGETIRVIDDPDDPDYWGRMSDPSNNPWVDPDTLQPAPIAETDDPYLFGDLKGHRGEQIAPYTGGEGSLPQAVAQTFLTIARSGGGGGGGGVAEGEPGMDDVTLPYDDDVRQGEGTPGAAGGSGRLEGANDGFTALTLTDTGAFAGLNLSGFVLNPLAGQGIVFEIDRNTDDELTIVAETDLEGDEVDLTSVPGLQVGSPYWITAPWVNGGSGGGGSGVHCAGTLKTGAPFSLPDWCPGVGGGAGGGSLRIESAGSVDVAGTGRVLAEGGEGGRTSGNPSSSAAGGGGGGGGTVRIQVGGTIRVTLGGLIGAGGGEGGEEGLIVFGGQGGHGRIRLEDFEGKLSPPAFGLVTDPVVTVEDIGRFLGGDDSFGQSRYYPTGVLLPYYRKVEIHYLYRSSFLPDEVQTGTYVIKPNGEVSGGPFIPPPFTFEISAAAANQDTGLLDSPPPGEDVAPFFNPAKVESGSEDGVLSDADTRQFLRFRFVLPRGVKLPSSERISQIRIDRVEIRLIQDKPGAS
ncbi:MAG: hypothetical protein AB1486_00175 [Planctomycetota bacterium]